MKFSTVTIIPGQKQLAQVNRKTGALYLAGEIWDQLPSDQKEFVLLHEKGHLQLQTADEFQANAYAVKNFAPAKTLTNKQLGKKIMVMSSALSKAAPVSNFTGELGAFAAGVAGSIVETLPVLGIGAKARTKETAANAAANVNILAAQTQLSAVKSKTTVKILVIAGVLLLVGIVTFLILRKK